MRFCASCGQRIGDNCDICPVCAHSCDDAIDYQKNPYDANKYSHGVYAKRYSVRPVMTYIFIALNIAVFVLISILSTRGIDLVSVLSMHRGAVMSGQYLRIVTSMFTHREFWHIFSNCYALLIYGMILEPAIGKVRYALIYFAGGLLGNLFTFAFMPNPSIGASGAIFGLLGAVIAINFINPTPISKGMTRNVIFSVVLTTIYGIGGNVNNLAHFGGLFGGYIMLCLTVKQRMVKRVFASRSLMAVVLAVILIFSSVYPFGKKLSLNEKHYGNYAYMCFYMGINDLEKAYKSAVKITEEESNIYSADAFAVEFLYDLEKGIEEEALAKYVEFMKINENIPMMDENIYNLLKKRTKLNNG